MSELMNLPEIRQMTIDVFEGRPVRGVTYFNTQIAGPGVTDMYDHEPDTQPLMSAGYWPGGAVNDKLYIVTFFERDGDPPMDENGERILLRELIMGASIPKDAQERYDRHVRTNPIVGRVTEALGTLLVPSVIQDCINRGIPLAYLVVQKVAASTIIEPGLRIASLSYPFSIPPKTALANLKSALRRTIQEEQL